MKKVKKRLTAGKEKKKGLLKILPQHLIDEEIQKIYDEHKPKDKHFESLKKFADNVYSVYIRITKSKKGICECITCQKKLHRSDIQNGHYRTRGCLKYRFSDYNCFPQCYRCNIALNGNYRNYHLFIVGLYGEEGERKLWTDQTQTKIKNFEYVDKIKEWYKKYKEEMSKRS